MGVWGFEVFVLTDNVFSGIGPKRQRMGVKTEKRAGRARK